MENNKYINILTKEYLLKKYIDNKKSLSKIANIVGCSSLTVSNWMEVHRIKRRTISEAGLGNKRTPYKLKEDKILTKEFLYKEYNVNKKSPQTIEKETEFKLGAVRSRLIKYKIPIRSYKEAVKFKKVRDRSSKHNPMYGNYKKDSISPLAHLIRHTFESKNWRKTVFKRDNYTCQVCLDRGSKAGNLRAHHIKLFSIILTEFLKKYNKFNPLDDKLILIKLAKKYKPFLDIDNGITLCEECHKDKHKKKENKLCHSVL